MSRANKAQKSTYSDPIYLFICNENRPNVHSEIKETIKIYRKVHAKESHVTQKHCRAVRDSVPAVDSVVRSVCLFRKKAVRFSRKQVGLF